MSWWAKGEVLEASKCEETLLFSRNKENTCNVPISKQQGVEMKDMKHRTIVMTPWNTI